MYYSTVLLPKQRNRFADFFCQKIEVVKNNLFASYTPVANSLVDAQACRAELTDTEIFIFYFLELQLL